MDSQCFSQIILPRWTPFHGAIFQPQPCVGNSRAATTVQVAALVVCTDSAMTADALRDWAEGELPSYQAGHARPAHQIQISSRSDHVHLCHSGCFVPAMHVCYSAIISRPSTMVHACAVCATIACTSTSLPRRNSQHNSGRYLQVPKIVKFVDQLPRNAMGKVNKIALRSDYF